MGDKKPIKINKSLTKKRMKTKKGFTLIELLIVIAIIGILSAALLPTILNAPARGRDAARTGNMNSIITALEAYNSDNGRYPDAVGCFNNAKIDGISSYFSGGVPTDPSQARDITDAPTGVGDCVGTGEYYYRYIGTNGVAEYIVATIMENPKANNSSMADLGAANPDVTCVDSCTSYILVK
jgi:prepilin-type N-terminal cleavage/methylation domain-containing protein